MSREISDYLKKMSEDLWNDFHKDSSQEEIDWDRKYGLGSYRWHKKVYEALARENPTSGGR